MLTLVFISCDKNTQPPVEQPSALYSSPITRPLKLHPGYVQQVITQDTILPLINVSRDTVKTGQVRPLQGIVQPKQVREGTPLPYKVTSRVIQKTKAVRAEAPTILTKKALPDSPKAPKKYTLTSVKRDTLPTGVPFRLKGKKQLLTHAPKVHITPPTTQKNTQYDIQIWDTQNGLISNTIYTMCRSQRGGLWLGTYKGISYFDGTTFTHYSTKEGLPDENIRGLCEDKQGNLWIGFSGTGVGKFDGDSLTLFNDNIPGEGNWSIIEDLQGNIWWGAGQGISKYDGRNLTQYTTNEGLSANHISHIAADKQGNIWIGTNTAGLCKFDGTSIVQYGQNYGLPEVEVAALLADAQGNVWISYSNVGLVQFDGQTFIQYPQSQGLPGKHILSMTQDLAGNLWLGNQQGLIQFDGKYFRRFAKEAGLEGSTVLDMATDDLGNLWLATYENGLMKGNFQSFEYLHLEDFTAFTAMDQDQAGNLWIGVESKGWLEFDGTQYTLYESEDLFADHLVASIKRDRKGNLWLGTSRGLIKYSQGKFTRYLFGAPIIALLEDKKGDLWVGSYTHGLFKFTTGQLINYKQGLFANGVAELIEDTQGNIWVGTDIGLSKCSGNQVIHYTAKEGVMGRTMLSILEDHQNQFWLGTYRQGLMHFDGKQFTYYTTKEGLSSNYIQSIAEDAQGNIWVATDKGLDCIHREAATSSSPSQTPVRFPIVAYHQMFRSHLSEFRLNSVAVTPDHRLWWGNDKYLVTLKPQNLLKSAKRTEVKLDQVDLIGQHLNYRRLSDSARQEIQFDSLAKFEDIPWGLSLPYAMDQVTFHFHSTELVTTHQALFSYRVKELSNQWSKPSPKTSLTYRNLPVGTFTLQLKTCDRFQQWSKTSEYTFTICAPWWQAWWFRLILLLLGILLLWSLHQWRVLYLRRKKRQLEQAVAIKTTGLIAVNRQLSTVNEKLRQSKQEVIQLKNKEQALLEQAMEEKERRFLTAVQLFDEKYQKLSGIEDELDKAVRQNNAAQLAGVQDKLRHFIKTIHNLDILTNSIESKYPQLLAEITTRFPHLSKNEVKHCLLIKLGCSAKEAAQLLEVSVHAVNTARKRLKKKLKLEASISLTEALK